jgi:hypothetical protein
MGGCWRFCWSGLILDRAGLGAIRGVWAAGSALLPSSDHAPPHFHARYGEYEAQIVIDTGDPLAGQLPIRALRLIREWTGLHQAELRENWERAQARTPLASIDPLP